MRKPARYPSPPAAPVGAGSASASLRGAAAAGAALAGILLAGAWIGLGGCSISAADLIATVDRRPLLATLRDSVILPGAAAFEARAAALEAAADSLEADPTAAALDSARARWREAALAWASLQPIRVGAIADLTPKLDFWPTRPSLIEDGLEADDPLDSLRMANLTPSAARGLPAVEWLLFAGSRDSVLAAFADSSDGPRRRRYLAAACADIRDRAADIVADWRGTTGDRFVYPAAGSRYPTTQMAVEELIKGLVTSLEEMKNAKVAAPAGAKSGGRPQPDLVEAPYAAASLELLAANLEGVESAFEGNGGTGIDAYLESLGSPLPGAVDKALSAARTSLEALTPPLSRSVVDEPAKVATLQAALTDLVVTVKNDVASALGVNITFTDNDGD